MRRPLALAMLMGSVLLPGCRSAYVNARVHNATGSPITQIEVDYPSASFGKDELAAGADFQYRFKILGSGPTKVLWTDIQHHEHSAPGPSLTEGQEGNMTILLDTSATWRVDLHPSH